MVANAILEYKKAIVIKPTHTKAINEIGWIFFNRGEREAAVKQWQKTLSINPKDTDAIFNLAKAYNDAAFAVLKRGRKKEALYWWKETLRINPSNKAAEYYLKKYSL